MVTCVYKYFDHSYLLEWARQVSDQAVTILQVVGATFRTLRAEEEEPHFLQGIEVYRMEWLQCVGRVNKIR